MRLQLLALTMLFAACSSRNQAPYQDSQPVEAAFTTLLPMNYVFPQMPTTVGVLQAGGKIVPHPKVKNYAVRFERGTWKIRGKHLVLNYQTFNAYGCEVQPCSNVSKEQTIELELGAKGEVKGLRTFNESKVGFDQLYYNESVVKDAPGVF